MGENGEGTIFTARKRSLGQGNIFSSVCQEFCSQEGGSVSVQDNKKNTFNKDGNNGHGLNNVKCEQTVECFAAARTRVST